jgi:acetyltransferase-like isoleucine patch superfamily enzyme
VRIGRGALARHPETFEIGDGVVIGEQAFIQGASTAAASSATAAGWGRRATSTRAIWCSRSRSGGDRAPRCSARSTPACRRRADHRDRSPIEPVRVGRWADIGVNAVLLPGVTSGRAPSSAPARWSPRRRAVCDRGGVPARFVRWREGHEERDID